MCIRDRCEGFDTRDQTGTVTEGAANIRQNDFGSLLFQLDIAALRPVSYTHLDVYKRQERDRLEHVIEDGEKQMRELEERIAIGDNRRALVEKLSLIHI